MAKKKQKSRSKSRTAKTGKRKATKVRKKAVVKKQKRGKAGRARPQATQTPPPKPKPVYGAFVWHELMTTDPAKCKSFYSDLFGWKTEEMEMMPGFTYTVFNQAKDGHAGMMAITPEHGEMRSHWDVYVNVKDVDATAARCEELGGEIVVPPHDIPVGRWAMLKDPTGAQICVYKSSRK
jgi:predicted enzyme related to lactoylglutathione lyase